MIPIIINPISNCVTTNRGASQGSASAHVGTGTGKDCIADCDDNRSPAMGTG
ncbi:MAG: hypothetical protein JWQ98_2370 [Chlorobi bacterium]|nr:hypothetical protein [Chlorobiota bacterium]